jgi:NAD(P)-dependent dehydrogenase (short-subunit alcohol dehydrogenase family)
MTSKLHAVVVGASGAMGLALTRALAGRDDVQRVFAVSRQHRTSDDPRVTWMESNVCDPDSLARLAQRIGAEAPRIHRLICCVGVLHADADGVRVGPEKALGQLRAGAFHQVMALNALAPLTVLHAFTPLLEHPDGSVAVTLSARVGSIGDNRLGGWYSYRMSKAALNMGIRTAAIELNRRARPDRPAPIVAAVHPGTTVSALSEPFLRGRPARSPDDSARHVLAVADGLTPADSGGFFNWDGQPLPW